MADKVRGALNGIDWSKSNQVSINVNKKKPESNQQRSQPAPQNRAVVTPSHHAPQNWASRTPAAATPHNRAHATPATTSRSEDGDIPINRYRSVVAPVKSGGEEQRSPPRRTQAENGHRRTSSHRSSNSGDDEDGDGPQVYVGYLGSLRVPPDSMSTGIKAIQRPMSGLYLPYREKKLYAQERIITSTSEGMEIYYLADPDAEEPTSITISWQDILYVEPLRFSTKKANKDRKTVMAAFEPCEAQRLAMLGNRDSLFAPLNKQHKHISLLKHPALLCLVIRSPHSPSDLFTHGYVCSTVEESVFLARHVRDELELLHRQTIRSGQAPAPGSGLSASHMSIHSDRYKIEKHTDRESKIKLKSKNKLNKRKERGTYTTHTGDDGDDLGTFHYGMTQSSMQPNHLLPSPDYGQANGELENSINDNFVIGRPGRQSDYKRQSQHSAYSDIDSGYTNGRPVGVVQPQSSAARDGFKVLPSNVQMDKSNLKPTALNIKSNRYSDVTPELDLKLRMRQQETSEPMLNPLAPRSVVNPLADAEPAEQHRRSFLSSTPGPISKMSTSLPFNPSAALPQSGWHEPVLGNFKSKERIDNRLNSQMVDTKELPKLESEKKEQEMANLFAGLHTGAESHEENNNFSMSSSGPTGQLHDAMGFMP